MGKGAEEWTAREATHAPISLAVGPFLPPAGTSGCQVDVEFRMIKVETGGRRRGDRVAFIPNPPSIRRDVMQCEHVEDAGQRRACPSKFNLNL
jgi:hypothetical protein